MKFFYSHLKETGESYLEHFLFAFTTAMWLFMASMILLSHAIFPGIFTTTTSRHVKKINELMQKRLALLMERRKNNEEGKNL